MLFQTSAPRLRWRAFVASLSLLMCCVTSVASASTVTYTTLGEFSLGGASGSSLSFAGVGNAITNGGITISFLSGGGTVDAPTNIGLGKFHVAGTIAGTFSDFFTLSVSQTIPLPGGTESFGTATVSGKITVNSSKAFVQFTSPLTVSIPGSPRVTYSIASADGGIPGKLLLNAPSVDTGAGLGNTTIQGVAIVPLPPAVWAGMSLMGLMGFEGMRRKRQQNGAEFV